MLAGFQGATEEHLSSESAQKHPSCAAAPLRRCACTGSSVWSRASIRAPRAALPKASRAQFRVQPRPTATACALADVFDGCPGLPWHTASIKLPRLSVRLPDDPANHRLRKLEDFDLLRPGREAKAPTRFTCDQFPSLMKPRARFATSCHVHITRPMSLSCPEDYGNVPVQLPKSDLGVDR